MGQRTRSGCPHPIVFEVIYSLTPEAEAELENAVAFCTAHFSRNVAESFLTTFELKIRLIAEFPGVGTPTNKGRRLFPIGRYPFSILSRSFTESTMVRFASAPSPITAEDRVTGRTGRSNGGRWQYRRPHPPERLT